MGSGTGTEDPPAIKIEDDEGFTYVMNKKTRRQVLKKLVVKMEELTQFPSVPGNWDDSEGDIFINIKCINYVLNNGTQ